MLTCIGIPALCRGFLQRAAAYRILFTPSPPCFKPIRRSPQRRSYIDSNAMHVYARKFTECAVGNSFPCFLALVCKASVVHSLLYRHFTCRSDSCSSPRHGRGLGAGRPACPPWSARGVARRKGLRSLLWVALLCQTGHVPALSMRAGEGLWAAWPGAWEGLAGELRSFSVSEATSGGFAGCRWSAALRSWRVRASATYHANSHCCAAHNLPLESPQD